VQVKGSSTAFAVKRAPMCVQLYTKIDRSPMTSADRLCEFSPTRAGGDRQCAGAKRGEVFFEYHREKCAVEEKNHACRFAYTCEWEVGDKVSKQSSANAGRHNQCL
jgi:hypothetical protein